MSSDPPLRVNAPPTASVAGTDGDAPAWNPPEPTELSALLPDYAVLSLLGRGGMGAVYCAVHKALDRAVALKLLPQEVSATPGFADRFKREARAMAKLSHPHIVAVHDFGHTAGGHLYFTMEYVEGTTLGALIHGPGLNELQALTLSGQICAALAYAHERGVVHRDMKPANVMVDKEGNAKVADFGLARLLDPEAVDVGQTAAGTVMGTPEYMAPEQRRGMDVDHRADIYSVGVMLYEMLCRKTPQGAFRPPSAVAGCDAGVDRIVEKAMQSEPELRYQQTVEMKAAVDSQRNRAPVIKRSRRIPFRCIIPASAAAATALILLQQNPWHETPPAPPRGATLTVTTAIDELDPPGTPGTGLSLREALRDSQTRSEIVFSPDAFRHNTSLHLNPALGAMVIDHIVSADASAIPGGVTLDGAVFKPAFHVTDPGSLTLTRVHFRNFAVSELEDDRRGIAIHNDGTVTLVDCMLSNNRGRGSVIMTKGRLTLLRCTFSANICNIKGAAVQMSGRGSRLEARHCTFSGNTAVAGGAVNIGNFAREGVARLEHCTIAGNQAIAPKGGGGGIQVLGGEVTVANCIIADNKAAVAGEENVNGPLIQEGNNLIGGNPMLAPLADNGGATPTMALLPGSPAIDAARGTPGTTERAQNGVLRILDGDGDGKAAPDLGAFEFAPSGRR